MVAPTTTGLLFGSINRDKPQTSVAQTIRDKHSLGWSAVLMGKDFLNRCSSLLGGFNTLVGSSRHISAQVLPVVSAFAAGTRFSRLLPGMLEASEVIINASDFCECIGDGNYVLNGGLWGDVKKGRRMSILSHAFGAIADVTNSVELLRVWDVAQFDFLGKVGSSLGSFTVYGRAPLAFAASVTVSGLCAVTLCSLYAVSTVIDYRKLGHENAKIQRHAHNQAKLDKHTEKLAETQWSLAKNTTKCALYTALLGLPLLGFAVPGVILGVLGSLAIGTSFAHATFKYRA